MYPVLMLPIISISMQYFHPQIYFEETPSLAIFKIFFISSSPSRNINLSDLCFSAKKSLLSAPLLILSPGPLLAKAKEGKIRMLTQSGGYKSINKFCSRFRVISVSSEIKGVVSVLKLSAWTVCQQKAYLS